MICWTTSSRSSRPQRQTPSTPEDHRVGEHGGRLVAVPAAEVPEESPQHLQSGSVHLADGAQRRLVSLRPGPHRGVVAHSPRVRDVVADELPHPAFHRRLPLDNDLERGGLESVHPVGRQLFEQALEVLEVVIERSPRHAQPASDPVDGEPAGSELAQLLQPGCEPRFPRLCAPSGGHSCGSYASADLASTADEARVSGCPKNSAAPPIRIRAGDSCARTGDRTRRRLTSARRPGRHLDLVPREHPMWTRMHTPSTLVTSRILALTACTLTLSLAIPAGASAQDPDAGTDAVKAGQFDYGKMWTFEYPPGGVLQRDVRLSRRTSPGSSAPVYRLLRIPGCSASFVSPNGLVATNHHCVRGAVSRTSRPGERPAGQRLLRPHAGG